MITSPFPHLPDLETPLVDLLGSEAPEAVLIKLKSQNDALAALREALTREEARNRRDVRAAA